MVQEPPKVRVERLRRTVKRRHHANVPIRAYNSHRTFRRDPIRFVSLATQTTGQRNVIHKDLRPVGPQRGGEIGVIADFLLVSADGENVKHRVGCAVFRGILFQEARVFLQFGGEGLELDLLLLVLHLEVIQSHRTTESKSESTSISSIRASAQDSESINTSSDANSRDLSAPKKKLVKSAYAVFNSGGVTGTIGIQPLKCQKGSNLVTVNLSGLDLNANIWDVHENPVPLNGDCSGTGARFTPVNPKYSNVGSMSDKLGNFSGEITISDRNYVDKLLPLNGAEAVVGRSFVIHATNGDILACANILAGAVPK